MGAVIGRMRFCSLDWQGSEIARLLSPPSRFNLKEAPLLRYISDAADADVELADAGEWPAGFFRITPVSSVSFLTYGS